MLVFVELSALTERITTIPCLLSLPGLGQAGHILCKCMSKLPSWIHFMMLYGKEFTYPFGILSLFPVKASVSMVFANACNNLMHILEILCCIVASVNIWETEKTEKINTHLKT